MNFINRRSIYLAQCTTVSFYRQKANVASWSPLGESFNVRPCENKYKQIFMNAKGIFEYRQLYDHEGLQGMKLKALLQKDALLEECLSKNRKRKLVQIIDDLSDTLCKVADLAEFLRNMHPDTDMIFAAQEICVELSTVVEELNTNKELYNCLKEVAENGDKYVMTNQEKHTLNLFLFDFEQCGIHLPERDRQLIVHYNNVILQLGQKFVQNAVQPRILSVNVVPPALTQYFHRIDDNLLITGYADIPDECAREHAYKTYFAGNEKQEKLLDDILLHRQKLARLCNFPTYAHRAVKGSTAENPEFVIEFLNMLNHDLQNYVKNDFDLMQNIKATNSNRPVAMWDVSYLINKIKKDCMLVNPDEFSSYFSLGACMEGINLLTQHLYGITLENENIAPGESWVPDLYKLKVIHETEGLLGLIYCDFFERKDKPAQDCHFTIKGGKRLSDGSYQNPIVVVVLNFPAPTYSTPSLLSPHMVENLFHEMGHALHSMLGRTEYQHITGTRCATDFAEVPSILMEYFCNDPRVLKSFAKHYKTGNTIPDNLLQALRTSKKICSAATLQSQIFYSALDYVYHTEESVVGRTTEVLAETQEKYYPVPYVNKTAWHLSFSHLIGYGARYYSYLMSRSIASTIWQMYFNKNPFNRVMGEKYRQECLAHGGGKPPRNLVKDYLNVDVTPMELTKSLVTEIQSNYKELS